LKNGGTSNQPEERLAQMLSKVKSRDFRLIPQRLAILRILAASEDHPSVEEVYEDVRTKFPEQTV
jgi:Fur family peroxide stress response transcriptional regulator